MIGGAKCARSTGVIDVRDVGNIRRRFRLEHGFAPTTTYELVREERRYPPKAILGTAFEIATGQRLVSADFEGGKAGAVRVLEQLGFTLQEKRQLAR